VPGDDDVGTHESAPRSDEASQECSANGERRVGNDAEQASWQPEVGCVGDDHGDVVFREPPPQLGGAPRVELDRDDMSATGDEGFGKRAGARPDVEHEIARADPSIRDKYGSPSTTELMPPPPCPTDLTLDEESEVCEQESSYWEAAPAESYEPDGSSSSEAADMGTVDTAPTTDVGAAAGDAGVSAF
jgi:hypothetical protein